MAEVVLNRVSIGSDPEFFIANKLAPFTPVAACGKFGGTKGNPIKIDGLGGYLEDGCAIEINPVTSVSGYGAFKNAKRLKQVTAQNVLWPQNFVFLNSSEVEFTEDELAHPSAKVIGCALDHDAYLNGAIRSPPDIANFGNWRFAGGHIHVGIAPWPKSVPRHIFAQFMDFYMLGPWHSFDSQPLRRAQYGLPGLFRPKPYGLEYRSFSNYIFNEDFPASSSFWSTLDHLASIFEEVDSNEQLLDDLGKVYNSIDWGIVQEKLSKKALTSKDLNELGSMQRSIEGVIEVEGHYNNF